MSGDLQDVASQALTFLTALVLGLMLGRYVFPRPEQGSSARSTRTSGDKGWPGSRNRPGPALPLVGVPAVARTPAAESGFEPDLASTIASAAPDRSSHVADEGGSADVGALPEQAQARVAELEKRLNESQWALTETWRQLSQAGTELVRLRVQVRELEDRAETEMGRLESGAIAALESTIAKHRDEVATLEEKLRVAEKTVAEQVRELAVERGRCAQLQSALAERDQHLATLTRERG